MGMRKVRKEAFLKTHPFCIFCGGTVLTDTVEHCPPRAMFPDRAWPEGFEFPACSNCNHGSADDDLLISFLARTDPFTDGEGDDGRMPDIIRSVHQKFPQLVSKMMPSAIEARAMNRRLGIVPEPGATNQEAGPVRVTDEIDNAVRVFAGKLTKAIYYLHTSQVFPTNGRIGLKWFTNADLVTNNGRYRVFESFQGLDGIVPALVRSRSLLNDQFEYKLSLSTDFRFRSSCVHGPRQARRAILER
ncbi:hypothetical protein [Massilia sp. WF1]|uniref:hypothetical protein n=1 Tax=Massilia sp. WF1 TaxID=1406431 RepID=UPI000A9DC060|nr:hypothetical protein [Massilia sp. WF1]